MVVRALIRHNNNKEEVLYETPELDLDACKEVNTYATKMVSLCFTSMLLTMQQRGYIKEFNVEEVDNG